MPQAQILVENFSTVVEHIVIIYYEMRKKIISDENEPIHFCIKSYLIMV